MLNFLFKPVFAKGFDVDPLLFTSVILRVAILPPAPRAFSNIVTSTPGVRCRRYFAHVNPESPAPIIAMDSLLEDISK